MKEKGCIQMSLTITTTTATATLAQKEYFCSVRALLPGLAAADAQWLLPMGHAQCQQSYWCCDGPADEIVHDAVHDGRDNLRTVPIDVEEEGECSDDFDWMFTFTSFDESRLADASTEPLPLHSNIFDMATCHSGSDVHWKLDLTLCCAHKWKRSVSLFLDTIKHRNDKLSEWAALYGRDPEVTEVVHYFTCLYVLPCRRAIGHAWQRGLGAHGNRRVRFCQRCELVGRIRLRCCQEVDSIPWPHYYPDLDVVQNSLP